MQIATWNVNSIRARLPLVLEWLSVRRPDVVCLQEIKCLDEQFPREPIEELGYRIATHGQKTYNGVAILSRRGLEDVRRGIPGEDEPAQARVIGAQVDDVLVLNLYVVNGEAVGTSKYDFKLRWLARLAEHIEASYDMGEKVVLCGDFNCTFDDRDVHDPERWREKVLCSTAEREAVARLMRPGFLDAFRKFHEDGGHYTWWDFRTRGWQRGQGLRIDHFLMSPPALEACTGVEIDTDARSGERPSDHAPLVATLA